MRIPKEWVTIISKEIVEGLLENQLIELKESKERVTEIFEELMIDELMVEDRLNDEVRRILKEHETEIEKGRMDFRALFDMTKKKLVRERNIIL
jgi:hypothetical protein